MASKRSQITMTDEEVQAYLESERVLNVATIGPTGHPHLVAMWFAMVDGNAVLLDVRQEPEDRQPAARSEDDRPGRER